MRLPRLLTNCALLFAFVVSLDAHNVSVVTQVGKFIGYQQDVVMDGSNVTISKFLGIPYAEPPVGNLRFRKPLPKAALGEPFVAHDFGSECVQINHAYSSERPTSEDCLFLNIYVPPKAASDPNLAVMIFIHGGAYVMGSSNAYVGDIMAARGGVIIVTINYRLSIFGFLNVQDGSPSNFGLWDQHMAIKWVHDNIRAFGGDSGRITIFGQSAGAGSVIYQGIYPGNKGLYQRIIAESGTASAQWGEAQRPLEGAKEFGSLVGCTQEGPHELLECLRQVPAKKLNTNLYNFTNERLLRSTLPFVPSPDNDFIPVSSRITLNKDKNDLLANQPRATFANIDLMMGVNSGEGVGLLLPAFGVNGDPEYFSPNRSYFEDVIVPLVAQTKFGSDASVAIVQSVINGYTAWEDPENPTAIRQKFLDINLDVQFLARTMQTIELYTQVSGKHPYVYYFTATPATHIAPVASWVNRPNHGEEMQFVFGGKIKYKSTTNHVFTPWEMELSNRMITMWSNFAKSGNPNTPHNSGVNWRLYSASSHSYLDIGRYMNQTGMKERLFEQRCYLWNTVLPQIEMETDVTDVAHCGKTTSGCNSADNGLRMLIFAFAMYLIGRYA